MSDFLSAQTNDSDAAQTPVSIAVSTPDHGGSQPAGVPIPTLNGPFHNMKDITSRPLEWIWKGLIPRGKLTLVLGEPGVGKSLFALSIAAMATRGNTSPASAKTGNSPETDPIAPTADGNSAGVVLIFSTDDASADTVRPRLEAANADLSRVFLMSSDFKPLRLPPYSRIANAGKELRSTRYLDQLDACLSTFEEHHIEVSLIVIDPIECFMNCVEREDDFTTKLVRLSKTAARTGAAIVLFANSMGAGTKHTIYANVTRGNEELASAARSVLLIAQDQEDQQRRLVLPVKLNLSETPTGTAFTIQSQAITFHPCAIPTIEAYFEQLRQKQLRPTRGARISKLQQVMDWLEDRLRHGSVARSLIESEAVERDFAPATVRRAFKALDGISARSKATGTYAWRLPEDSTNQRDQEAAIAE